MFRKLRLQNKLMLTIMIVIVILLLSFMLYLYAYTKSALTHTELVGLAPTTQKISDQVDTLYKQIDYAALGFTSNQDNMDVMVDIGSATGGNNTDSYVALSKMAHNLNAIYNVVSELYKVIVFNSNKGIFYSYFRDDPLVTTIPAPYSSPTYASGLFKDDKPFAILPPHPDAWSTTPETVISVVRKFSTPYRTDFGMVEIQLPYRSLEQITTIDSHSSDKQVYLFSSSGELLFPTSSTLQADEADIAKQLGQRITSNTLTNGLLKQDGSSSLVSAYSSSYLNWITVIVDNGTVLRSNLHHYRQRLAMIGAMILIVILAVYYFAIRRLMKPLLALTRSVRTVNLNNLAFQPAVGESRDYDEIKLLNRAFEGMIEKLKLAISTEYEYRIRNMEANYSALQAQINPHFLFNTLNVIAVHCEETNSSVAAEMSYRLSEMMRYSGSSSGPSVRLADEIKYSIDYLDLMKLHYDESLFYELHIPEEMADLPLPKLALQPFVENSINHGFDTKLPPWIIRIDGHFESLSDWCIRIADNGSGFDPAKLAKLRDNLSNYRMNVIEGKLLTNLQVSGMGVLNTYARLLMQFGETFYLEISNLEPQGSQIVFGVHNSK